MATPFTHHPPPAVSLSVATGMSMFSTRNGLYDRARRRFKIQDGIKLFTYSFYKQRREEVQVRATLLSTLCDCWVKEGT